MTLNAEQVAQVHAAAQILRGGGLVAFATETVYGLGADALNEAAVRLVFETKGRPSNNPLIVHVGDQAMAARLAAPGAWEERAARVAAVLWPGPLTIVVPKSAEVSALVTAGGPTVALRMPAHQLALALIQEFGGPIVGPSANRSGHVSPTTAEHVRAEFGEGVFVLDGGACQAGIESTVLWLGDGKADSARILRPGVVSVGRISEALGEPVLDAAPLVNGDGDRAMASPGLLSRHYSPRTRTVMFEAEEWSSLVGGTGGVEARRVGVLTHAPLTASLLLPAPGRVVTLPEAAAGYAAGLYAALRELDEGGLQMIAVQRPPTEGRNVEASAIWRAVADRLSRASERDVGGRH